MSEQPKFLSHKSHEWYTPVEIISRVHLMFGDEFLDPMSCDEAQKTVQAATYYTADNDGLSKPWTGKVFLNPPWHGTLKFRAIAKVLDEPDEAILVLNSNSLTTKWFKPLLIHGTICLPSFRPKFSGHITNAPTSGAVIVYLGENKDKFNEVFASYGTIMEQYGYR